MKKLPSLLLLLSIILNIVLLLVCANLKDEISSFEYRETIFLQGN